MNYTLNPIAPGIQFGNIPQVPMSNTMLMTPPSPVPSTGMVRSIPALQCVDELRASLRQTNGQYFSKGAKGVKVNKESLQYLLLVVVFETNNNIIFITPFQPNPAAKSYRTAALRVTPQGPSIDSSGQAYTYVILSDKEINTLRTNGALEKNTTKAKIQIRLYPLYQFVQNGLNANDQAFLSNSIWHCEDQSQNVKPKAIIINPVFLPTTNVGNATFFNNLRQALLRSAFNYYPVYYDENRAFQLENIILIVTSSNMIYVAVSPGQVTNETIQGKKVYMLYYLPNTVPNYPISTGVVTQSGKQTVASYLLLTADRVRQLYSAGSLIINDAAIGHQTQPMALYMMTRDQFIRGDVPTDALTQMDHLFNSGLPINMVESLPNLYFSPQTPVRFIY